MTHADTNVHKLPVPPPKPRGLTHSLELGEVAQRVHVGTRVLERAEAEERERARDISTDFRGAGASFRKDFVAKEEFV
jgi:hypothetical protein